MVLRCAFSGHEFILGTTKFSLDARPCRNLGHYEGDPLGHLQVLNIITNNIDFITQSLCKYKIKAHDKHSKAEGKFL